MRRAALYVRVSTLNGQTTENQERALREVADRMGCEIVHVYRDQGISGAKGRNGRPAFDALCKGAARREFDIVMAWSVDRLGRSLQDLVAFLTELHALKIDLYLHQQGVDTTTPGGKALFQMMGVFAEFERSIIQDRIHAGLCSYSRPRQASRPAIDPGHDRAQNPGRPEEGRHRHPQARRQASRRRRHRPTHQARAR